MKTVLRNRWATIGRLVAPICLAVVVSSPASAAGQCVTVDQIRSKGGWDIVTETPTFEPYWFTDDKGNFQGQDFDLLVEVNKILNIPKTRYTAVPWAGVLPAVQTGKSDFTPEGVAVTEARRKTFAFSYPEGDNSIIIMTRPDTNIKSASDLKNVAVEMGSAGEAAATKLSDDRKAAGKNPLNIKSYQELVDIFLDVGNKRIDAVATNIAPITAYMNKHPGKFTNAGMIGEPLYASWVFRKEDMGPPGCIGTEVNKALYELRKNGTLKKIQLKWFGHEMELPDYDTWKSVD